MFYLYKVQNSKVKVNKIITPHKFLDGVIRNFEITFPTIMQVGEALKNLPGEIEDKYPAQS